MTEDYRPGLHFPFDGGIYDRLMPNPTSTLPGGVHYPPTNQRPIVDRFEKLVETWTNETLAMSSLSDMFAHPSYVEIIGMGPAAVPLLLNQLRKDPDYWFEALHAITGDDPVPDDVRGDLLEMTRCWLEWGDSEGYYD